MKKEMEILNAIKKLEEEIKERLIAAYKDACRFNTMQYTVYLEDDLESVNVLEDVAGGTMRFDGTWGLWTFCFQGSDGGSEDGVDSEEIDPEIYYREIVEEWERKVTRY